MLTSPIEEIRKENAIFARDTEYLKETAFDDILDERVEAADFEFNPETIEELKEAAEMVNRLPDDEDVVAESTEIEKILNATENLTFEEMTNI